MTELVFILDRSGSMAGLETDTIGGFNAMIEKQKKEAGEALVTTVLFDNESVTVHDRIPLQEVPPLTEKEYFTRGCTALLDAVGGTIRHIANLHRYIRREDVPERTLFWLAALGGGLGGVLGMFAFRHKTRHASFCIGMPLLMLLNFAAAYLLLRYVI